MNYIAPLNIAKFQLMKDLPKYGNSILSILRTDKAKFREHAIVQFKSTVGSAEGAAVHFRSVISDLETLEQWTQQDLKALTMADSEKICPTLSRCNAKVMEWMPTLRAGACNAPLRLLRNIVNNVMPHLVDTEVAVKVKVLNSFLATARMLSDAQLVQGIVDIQLNLENAFQSGHVEELVQMMKATTPPQDFISSLGDLTQVLIGKPVLSISATAALADVTLGDNLFRLAAQEAAKKKGGPEMMTLLEHTSGALVGLEKKSAELDQIAKVLSAATRLMTSMLPVYSAQNGADMRRVVAEVNGAARHFKATEGSVITLGAMNKLPLHKDNFFKFTDGPLKDLYESFVKDVHPKIVEVLQALVDDTAAKLSKFKLVCRCGELGAHWGDADEPQLPILKYAEKTLLKVLQPPLQSMSDSCKQAERASL